MRVKSLTGPVVGLYLGRVALGAAVFGALLVSLLTLQRNLQTSHSTSNALVETLDAGQSFDLMQSDLSAAARGDVIGARAGLRASTGALAAELRHLTADGRSAGIPRLTNRFAQIVRADVAREIAPALAAGASPPPSELRILRARWSAANAQLRHWVATVANRVVMLRNQRHSQVTRAVDRAIVFAAVGLGLALALELGFLSFLVRGILRPVRQVAQAAARLAAGDLGARVPSRGRGETAMLAEAFNAMAASLQERDGELAATRERLVRAAAVSEEASEMKTTFLANMSHEIRTPLSGVIGMLRLLAEAPLDAEQRSQIEVALASADALLGVVGDVLDIAKIEAGRLEIEVVEFDPRETVEAVCDLLAAEAAGKGLTLQAVIAADVPAAVLGDQTRVAQVLTNLVSNAVKFTVAGEVSVTVRVHSRVAAPMVIGFEVRDTGIGIEQRQLARLFEPFVQADPGTTRKFGGTGLGLAIARELTELMGGTIHADSEPGRGSTFAFAVPLVPAARPIARGRPAAGAAALRDEEVLVATPSTATWGAVRSYLSELGARSVLATDARSVREAIEAARAAERPLRLAVVDSALGEDGAAEVLALAAETLVDGARSVVLLVPPAGTVAPGSETGQRVTKPVRRERLFEAVAVATGRRPDVQPAAEPGPVEPLMPTPSGRRVLVAEDDDVGWLIIERMLALRGHAATRAADGEHALELLGRHDYELLMIDCRMPLRDGFDTVRELRRREALEVGPQGAGGRPRLPVIGMSAGTTEGIRERCLDAGMDDFLVKPLSSTDLDRAFARWLAPRPVVRRRIDDGRIADLEALFPGAELGMLIGEIRAQLDHDLRELAAAVRRRDQESAAAAAHRIRNTAQLLGASELAAAAAGLDRPPRPDRPPSLPDGSALARVREHCESALAALDELIDRTAPGIGAADAAGLPDILKAG
jgi:signal transduction histidine kinase/CheY-like chemotaxis protein